MSPETLKPQEGRALIMVAACQGCNWYRQIPSTTLRLAEDSKLFKEIAQKHGEMYKHIIKYSIK